MATHAWVAILIKLPIGLVHVWILLAHNAKAMAWQWRKRFSCKPKRTIAWPSCTGMHLQRHHLHWIWGNRTKKQKNAFLKTLRDNQRSQSRNRLQKCLFKERIHKTTRLSLVANWNVSLSVWSVHILLLTLLWADRHGILGVASLTAVKTFHRKLAQSLACWQKLSEVGYDY